MNNETLIKLANQYCVVRQTSMQDVTSLVTFSLDGLSAFAEAAQQVKELVFEPCNIQKRDLPVAHLKAETPLGSYTIHKYKYFGDQFATNFFYSGPFCGGKSMSSEDSAIAAANADYKRRALSSLVWGGV